MKTAGSTLCACASFLLPFRTVSGCCGSKMGAAFGACRGPVDPLIKESRSTTAREIEHFSCRRRVSCTLRSISARHVSHQGAIFASTPATFSPQISPQLRVRVFARLRAHFGRRDFRLVARMRGPGGQDHRAVMAEPYHSRRWASGLELQELVPSAPVTSLHSKARLCGKWCQLRHSPITPKLLVLVRLVVNLCLLHFCSVASTSVSTDASSAAQNGASASAPTSTSCAIDSRS